MTDSNKCPNCGQYKIIKTSVLRWILAAVVVCGILLITLPVEVILIPVAILAALVPSMRATHPYCRNCRWTDKSVPADA
jgi:4-amino-4-deoxy-L-arabinose transferase-like glycosyltransferase